jgi:hypothetical protein
VDTILPGSEDVFKNGIAGRLRLFTQEAAMTTPSGDKPDRINLNDKAACESWAHKLNVTHEKLREAVGTVGDDAREVEKHLKRLTEKTQGGRGTA